MMEGGQSLNAARVGIGQYRLVGSRSVILNRQSLRFAGRIGRVMPPPATIRSGIGTHATLTGDSGAGDRCRGRVLRRRGDFTGQQIQASAVPGAERGCIYKL